MFTDGGGQELIVNKNSAFCATTKEGLIARKTLHILSKKEG